MEIRWRLAVCWAYWIKVADGDSLRNGNCRPCAKGSRISLACKVSFNGGLWLRRARTVSPCFLQLLRLNVNLPCLRNPWTRRSSCWIYGRMWKGWASRSCVMLLRLVVMIHLWLWLMVRLTIKNGCQWQADACKETVSNRADSEGRPRRGIGWEELIACEESAKSKCKGGGSCGREGEKWKKKRNGETRNLGSKMQLLKTWRKRW